MNSMISSIWTVTGMHRDYGGIRREVLREPHRGRKDCVPHHTAALIFGLGIAGIGLANAKVICRHFDFNLDAMRKAGAEELYSIDGIGGVLADAWVTYFKNDRNNETLDHLLADLTFEKEVRNEEQTLAGRHL